MALIKTRIEIESREEELQEEVQHQKELLRSLALFEIQGRKALQAFYPEGTRIEVDKYSLYINGKEHVTSIV